MVITERLPYRDGETPLLGYLAFDDSARSPRPGVIIAPEAPGLGDHVKRRARLFAEAGFVALALDPYGDGRHYDDLGEMMARVEHTRANPDAWRRRLGAGLAALAALPVADGERLCAVGYCFGGTGVLELARAGTPLRGTVCFHGELTPGHHGPEGIRSPILVLTGAEDPLIPAEQRQRFEAEMRGAGADWEMILYGGARHGFTNPEADLAPVPGMGFDAEVDRRSWQDMMNWLTPLLA